MPNRNDGKYTRQSYELAPNLTLINDSCGIRESYLLRDPDQGFEHQLDQGDYLLLAFLLKPRRYHEIREYYEKRFPREVSSPKKIECSLDEYLARFLGRKLVRSGRGRRESYGRGVPLHVPGGMVETENRRRAHVFPISVAFCPTNRCNLACRHCSQGSVRGGRGAGELSTSEITGVFDQLERYGIGSMRITGGEPFVRRDFLEILEEAAARRFALYLFTNGTILNPASAKRIAAVTDIKRGNFLVHLSLDGGTKESHEWLRGVPGSFERLVRSMRLLHDHNVPFYCEMNLNRKNLDTLEDAVRLLISCGAGSISMHTSSSNGRAAAYDPFFLSIAELRRAKIKVNKLREKYRGKLGIRFNSYNFPLVAIGEKYLDLARKEDKMLVAPVAGESVTENLDDPLFTFRCNAAVGQMTIGADGKVYPCPNCFGTPEFEAGDVRRNDLMDIWRQGNWGIFRELWYCDELHLCRSCKWLRSCRLGFVCRPVVFNATGDLFGPPPACILAYKQLGFKKRQVVDYLRSASKRVPAGRNAYLRHLLRTIA